MRFKFDENLNLDAVNVFRERGWGVSTVHDEGLRGAKDGLIADAAVGESRVVVTLDLDFSDVRHYPPASFPGIIVIRLGRAEYAAITEILRRVAALLDEQPIAHQLWVVRPDSIRVRE